MHFKKIGLKFEPKYTYTSFKLIINTLNLVNILHKSFRQNSLDRPIRLDFILEIFVKKSA